MSDTLETRLRDALHACADEVPDSAVRRVRSVSYQPRARDLRPRVAGGAVAAAAVAGGTVAALGLGGAAPAFAGWKAHPTTAAQGQVANAIARCTHSMAAISGSKADRAVSAKSGQPLMPTLSTMAQVVSDTRGPFTFLVYANASTNATCLGGPGFTQPQEYHSDGAPPAIAPGGIMLFAQTHSLHARAPYTVIEGQVGSGVSAVTFNLSDSTTVQATTGNGWFAAWWPSDATATSASLTTGQATTTTALPAAQIPPCIIPQKGSLCPKGGGPNATPTVITSH